MTRARVLDWRRNLPPNNLSFGWNRPTFYLIPSSNGGFRRLQSSLKHNSNGELQAEAQSTRHEDSSHF
jgi:hypothetical protein